MLDGLGLAGIFERMEIAEDEIGAARERHPDADDSLYHGFLLLTPAFDRMEYEPIYRSHYLRHIGKLHHIGIGRTYERTRVILIVQDLNIRVVHAATGELVRALTLDPDYQPTGRPNGPNR